ncbi:transcriptional regulator [Pilimelia terevasa]|uniref:Transcriptional regulator n=1 Tax=Pilimelia terevasa TaxID=53372 RepID=A0A8J3FFZ2_9ACTN|nr:helix-turn-helix domain-containing protein [Pilimelia terevasa]GGK14854.1 transcriptional regulator [Pilimelia terevasa]
MSDIRLTDSATMWALAHPTRLRLLGELRARGPATVGRLATRTGQAVGSVSYHLRTLAAHGLVTEAAGHARDRRERWWQAAHETTSFAPADVRGDPEGEAAMAALRRSIIHGYARGLERALDQERHLPPEWVAATGGGDELLHLTVEEAAELRAELEATAARWHARGAAGRPGAEPVWFIYQAVRREPTPSPAADGSTAP